MDLKKIAHLESITTKTASLSWGEEIESVSREKKKENRSHNVGCLRKLIVAQLVENSHVSMDHKYSLQCSQHSATGRYPEPDISSPHPPHTLYFRQFSILSLPFI